MKSSGVFDDFILISQYNLTKTQSSKQNYGFKEIQVLGDFRNFLKTSSKIPVNNSFVSLTNLTFARVYFVLN